ncbi:hypothetical protein KIW84_054535 [Lathyrus oleraceus]|uniref:Uncharacterized protein n=1 Tax=Pisum sativum TaxID=3888 RepID=A0A9D4WY51_PEA|nr:hypothetical protein KIW84_054535 [Pisum sativum]
MFELEETGYQLIIKTCQMATQRGVVFEVSYSGLIADVQLRRQLISGAKLLIDWTRGRDIVFSSAAPSVSFSQCSKEKAVSQRGNKSRGFIIRLSISF